MSADVDGPNVVLVHCHDLGRHLGCYGRGVSTPNIDGLADDGVRFTDYFCTAPQCSPSRASIYTGRYPHEVGMLGLSHLGWDIDDGVRTLPEYFGDEGFETALFGFQHVVDWDDPGQLGYDRLSTDDTTALDVAENFAGALDDLAGDRPFLATLGMTEPHLPVQQDHVPDADYDYYHPDTVDPLPYLPDCRAVREDLADYSALVTATVDRAVGRVRDALEAAGLTEDTLVVFTTDHGIPFPRAKGTCYDSGLETALLMAQPGRLDAGATEDALLSNVDLLPTLLDYVGADPPSVSGRSFAPLLTGGDYERRERVFAEMTYHGDYHPMRAVRTREYKYVRNFGHGPTAYLPGDVYEMRAGQALHDEFYGSEKRPEEECYYLPADPHERGSVAGGDQVFDDPEPADPEHADAVHDLRGAVHDWMARTGDPLLDGPVPLPSDTQRGPFGSA